MRKTIIALAAGSAVLLAASATARPTGGIWADHGPKKKKRPKVKAPAAVEQDAANDAVAPAEPAAPDNASLQAVAQASTNAAVAAGAVAAGALPDLKTGLNVTDSSGTYIGTVSQIVTASDQSIRLVIVAGSDGRIYRLLPDRISVSGGVVSTTQTDIR